MVLIVQCAYPRSRRLLRNFSTVAPCRAGDGDPAGPLGLMVTGNTYRHPAVLAKMATTVDIISGGRLILGLGAGWFELEHQEYGIPFYTTGGRLRLLDESLQMIKALWTQEHANFSGKHFKLENASFNPKPLQRPHPPILIGASGEKIALGIVARHAQMWNSFGTPEVFRT
jgi:alkanesulfonate monooxygenase SsuD/methylene tetrahydromethanopterin reductase-like flavin-dependent oxidoreductase (luciferase family)